MMNKKETERGEWDIDEVDMLPVRGPEEIPHFADEDEEDAFWSTHYIGDDWFDRAGEVPPEFRPAARLRRQANAQRAQQT